LFGRADGGGLEGAGAIISKENYIASNLSVKQARLRPKLMYILQEMCGWTGLEDKTIRFNIDLQKSTEQRLKEQLMKEQVSQSEYMTEQMKLQQPLFKKQIELQTQMADVQMKMMKENPEAFMQQSDEDEENLEKKEPKNDMVSMDFIKLKLTYDMLQKQYNENTTLIKFIQNSMSQTKQIFDKENEAYKRLFLKKK
jgi:hypothetical protein